MLALKRAAQQTAVPFIRHVSSIFVFDYELYKVVDKGCGYPNHPSQRLVHKVHNMCPYLFILKKEKTGLPGEKSRSAEETNSKKENLSAI